MIQHGKGTFSRRSWKLTSRRVGGAAGAVFICAACLIAVLVALLVVAFGDIRTLWIRDPPPEGQIKVLLTEKPVRLLLESGGAKKSGGGRMWQGGENNVRRCASKVSGGVLSANTTQHHHNGHNRHDGVTTVPLPPSHSLVTTVDDLVVICVGDSITFGNGTHTRRRRTERRGGEGNYPLALAALLAKARQDHSKERKIKEEVDESHFRPLRRQAVFNFGVSGSTAIAGNKMSYRGMPEFKLAQKALRASLDPCSAWDDDIVKSSIKTGSQKNLKEFGETETETGDHDVKPVGLDRAKGLRTRTVVLVVMLGTNDSKDKRWPGRAAFTVAYRSLLRELLPAPTADKITSCPSTATPRGVPLRSALPRLVVVLMTPPPASKRPMLLSKGSKRLQPVPAAAAARDRSSLWWRAKEADVVFGPAVLGGIQPVVIQSDVRAAILTNIGKSSNAAAVETTHDKSNNDDLHVAGADYFSTYSATMHTFDLHQHFSAAIHREVREKGSSHRGTTTAANTACWLHDGIHPTVRGHELIAAALGAFLLQCV